jgi:phage FluMu gp28-like protein
VVSRTDPDSIEVIKKAGKHAEVLCRLGSQWAVGTPRVHDFTLASGGRVVACSSEGAGRGMSGNVILDEFAYHEHAEKVWDGASAVVMHGYRMRVLSTPNGVGNLFHRLCTEPTASAGFTKHSTTLDEARGQGLTVDEVECWSMARGDPRVFDQLFRCSFLDAEEQYIPTALIQEASRASTALAAGETYGGLDIGLTNDLTALCVVRFDERGCPWVQEIETCRRTSWEDQQKMVSASFKRWQWRRLAVDSTGLGKIPAEMLVRQYGGMVIAGKPQGGRVEPVDFTLKSKEDLATMMYSYFARKNIAIPTHDSALRDDLCALRRIVTAAGNVRYDAQRTDAGHADRAWALALALHAGTRPTQRRDYSAIDRSA